MELNYKALNERICLMDSRAALVDYIYRTQGFGLERLDFKQAASELEISVHTVSRYVGELADRKIIVIIGNELKINDDLKAVG